MATNIMTAAVQVKNESWSGCSFLEEDDFTVGVSINLQCVFYIPEDFIVWLNTHIAQLLEFVIIFLWMNAK